MLEILYKVSFFLSMLVAYAYVTSTSKVILIVLVYSLCVFSYYHFNVIQSAIDEFLKYFNFNEKFHGNINSSQVPIPYVNPVESASYHNIKYPSLRQMSNYKFDKSTLRHLSKVPRINSAPAIRIAPPEPISISNLNDKYVSNNDRYNEDIKNDKYLQVLREISRKRNYQEEPDRIDSTPKKSRRNDIKHFMTSHSKRSHDDGSYDSLDDTSRKKRCSDSDRSVAKILSYTSSLMHVVAPNLSWNNHSKKRKSSNLAKSVNEFPEKVEKLRKINHDEVVENIENHRDEQNAENRTYVVKQQIVPVEVHENFESPITNGEECNSRSLYEPPLPDDDGEYVRVAGGKILNRTNCMYRKKLNSNRIDPQSIITLEPELVNGNSNDDDETMKKNLLQNLIDDIERKGEKDDNVIFYENSIVEEIAKNQNKLEPTSSEVAPNNPSPSFNPLLSQNMPSINAEKSSFDSNLTPKPSNQPPPVPKQLDHSADITFANNSTSSRLKSDSIAVTSTIGFNSSIINPSTFNASPVGTSTFNLNQSSHPLFGNTSQAGIDTINSASKSNPEKPEKKDQIETTQASVNNSASFTASTVTTAETSKTASPKNGSSFPCFTSTAACNELSNSTSVVNSGSFNVSVSSTQQSCSINAANTTTSNTPIMNFVATTSSSFSLPSKNDSLKNDALSNTPQFTNSFTATNNISKPTENVQKSPLSGITMFGSSPISTSANGTSKSNVVFTSSNSVPSFTSTTSSTQFQFGQTVPAPSSNVSAGFSFGSSANTSNGGFSLGTSTSTPTAFSVSTPAFGTASTSSFNTTSVLSFSSSTPPTFGPNAGLKFDAKPTQSAPSFPTPIFNATTTISSFVTPSVPSFGTTQNTTFGMAGSGGFGATSNAQSNSTFGNTVGSQPSTFGATSTPALTFGNTSIQPQTNSTFGNTTAQSTPAFGHNQSPAFGTAQNNMFGSGDPSIFSQNTKPAFGATNPPQFGSSGFTFGGSSTETQSIPAAFGSTPASTPFGNTSATQPPNFNSTTPAFNFTSSNPTPFGGNVFGAAAAKPAESTFAFGSSNVASAPALTQNSVFQFGTAPQQTPQQNQTFTFAASTGATGGFSIGTGGNTRNRAVRNKRK